MLIDDKQRQIAISPNHSCLVRAPAGSGKTSLIIARILLLLQEVKHPSQILVLTFTRAATEEIKLRVKKALEESHPQIEKKAKALGWTEISNAIQIQSYDQWASKLLNQLSQLPAQRITPTPHLLYEEAIERFLETDLYQTHSLTAKLLSHDNRAQLPSLKKIFAELLSKREQWLPSILQNDDDWANRQWQVVLQDVTSHLLELISTVLHDFTTIINYCQTRSCELQGITNLQKLNTEDCIILAKWLLTKDGKIRKPTSKMGFEAKASASDKALAQAMKEQFGTISEYFSQPTHLFYWQLLATVSSDEQQSQTLSTLCQILPAILAHCKCVFDEQGVCDFPEINLELLRMLQQDTHKDHPLLRQTEHILLDEFQDTSPTQYQLLGQFTQEWSLDGQSTVFIVGDPMQSIYGFRNADVRLFLSISNTRMFHHIPIKTLSLQANFRSSPEVVDLSNQLFPHLCPDQIMLNWCAIPYQCSHAMQEQRGNHHIHEVTPETQNEQLIDLIQKHPSEPSAILVRTRHQGRTIAKALQRAEINCDSQSLDYISDDPLCHDLLCLYASICQPECNIAWSALSQTPWLRLSYANLHQLLQKQNCIRESLLHHHQQLHEPAGTFMHHYQDSSHLPAIQQFYYLLETITPGLSLTQNIATLLDYLHATPPTSAYLPLLIENSHKLQNLCERVAPIQIMTIHQSKGLEFDHVFLPFTWEKTHKSASKVLSWDSWLSRTNPTPLPLIASHLGGHFQSTWLDMLRKKKELEEQKRLLYVALSRAKRHIHIFTHQDFQNNSFQALMAHASKNFSHPQ